LRNRGRGNPRKINSFEKPFISERFSQLDFMPIKKQIDVDVTVATDASLTRAGRWFYTRRRLALFLMAAVGLTTPVLMVLNWNHKLFFIPLELGTKFLMVYPAVRANCRWFGPVVTRFRTRQKAVWLTIDDGPHPEDTPQLLELLKKHDAHATFFVIGRHVQKYPELARAILRGGHTLGNHTQTHPVLFFWSFLETRLAREMDQCNQILHEVTGARAHVGTSPVFSLSSSERGEGRGEEASMFSVQIPSPQPSPRLGGERESGAEPRGASGEPARWFRAPAGMANLFLHFLLRDRKMKLIGWSARGFDGLLHDTESMANRICRSIQPGAVILLHEGRRDRQARPINLILAETILTRLGAEGYVFTVPDEKDFL
jgi:peptidoglycan/xylan/chitin deacetylase (PgdA/CDA1 family)